MNENKSKSFYCYFFHKICMKFIKKYFPKIINIVLIISLSFYALCFAIKKARNYEIYKQPKIEEKIYTIWHIETFEGGSKPRKNFLTDVAEQLEKKHAGILFYVKTIEPEKLNAELEVATPDIISFGFGVGQTVLPILKELNSTFNVRDELVESGSFNGKIFALPYIVSGYAMITHGSLTQNLHCGTNNYTNPQNATDIKTFAESESQYEAYKDFVYNKDVTLLGTARDVFRVSNLNNIGRATAIISPIDCYTDLIQYISLITNNNITKEFISYLLNKNQQSKLKEYSLFSSLYINLYSSGIYSDMEQAILSCQVPKVFDALS